MKSKMEKVVKKRKINDPIYLEDLQYWLSKNPEERISAVEYLRKQYYGNSARLQRSVKIIQRSQG